MAFSESDLKWIAAHGGKVGAVSEAEAAELEREYAEKRQRQQAVREAQTSSGAYTATPAPRADLAAVMQVVNAGAATPEPVATPLASYTTPKKGAKVTPVVFDTGGNYIEPVYQPTTKIEKLALGALPGTGKFQSTFSDALTKLEGFVGRGSQDTSKASKALRFAGGLGAGIAIAALSPVAIVDTMLASSGISGKKRAAIDIATGMKDYFVSLPVAFANDPYYTVGEVAGMIGGGKAVVKMARTARVWADPYGVPARAVGIEFSVSKIPTGSATAATMANMGKALAKAQKDVMNGKLSGTATVGGVTIKYRGSPIQHTVGGIVMHATPDVSALIKNPQLIVASEGMYFSPQLAPRFMASSAAGTSAVRPGVVAVLTDASKVRTPSTAALGKLTKSAGDNFIVHADEGLWSPSKLYKHAFENEIVASPGTKFTKTPSTLRARLLGDKAGDLLVQYSGPDAPGIKSGQLVPMHIFADKGVFRTPPTPAALYAAKLTTIWESLKDVGVKVRHPLSGNKTFKITGNALADQIALTKALKDTATNVAKDKVPSGTGARFDTAYRRALTVEYAKLTRTMNTSVSAAAARAYAKNPARFEAAYARNLTENLNNVARAASREQAYSDTRAASGRTQSVTERQLPEWQRAEKERVTDKQRERGDRDTQREREITPRDREVPVRDRTERTPTERPPERTERPDERTERPNETIQPPGHSPITLTQQQYAGVVGWRQGIFYIMAYPPYGKANVIYTRKPVPGISYARGATSPQRSAAVIGGKLPHAFEVAMGIAKVRITPHKTGKAPRMTFTQREVRPRFGRIR